MIRLYLLLVVASFFWLGNLAFHCRLVNCFWCYVFFGELFRHFWAILKHNFWKIFGIFDDILRISVYKKHAVFCWCIVLVDTFCGTFCGCCWGRFLGETFWCIFDICLRILWWGVGILHLFCRFICCFIFFSSIFGWYFPWILWGDVHFSKIFGENCVRNIWKILWIFDNYLGDIGDVKQNHLREVGLVFPSHEWVPGKWGLAKTPRGRAGSRIALARRIVHTHLLWMKLLQSNLMGGSSAGHYLISEALQHFQYILAG